MLQVLPLIRGVPGTGRMRPVWPTLCRFSGCRCWCSLAGG